MKVFPVVHIQEIEQATEQSCLALDAGADGIYLIDHNAIDPSRTFEAFNEVDKARPDAYVGINLLSYHPTEAANLMGYAVRSGRLVRAPDALWSDNVLSERDPAKAYEEMKGISVLASMRYLGGVAFKYTKRFTEDPVRAAREAELLEPFTDVVTTSGAGTGKAPTPAKIIAMKQAIKGDLAVASGIDINNVNNYRGYVDEVLVSSSVETKPYSGIFDEAKLRAFIAAVHAGQ